MKKLLCSILLAFSAALPLSAQGLEKVYDETIDPLQQIDDAVARAKAGGRLVLCQLGGNWCPWCLRLADFVKRDSVISEVMQKNFEYIHVNYNPRQKTPGTEAAGKRLLQRLDNAGRFGYPALVVLSADGRVLHIQDSSFLEEGQGYSAERVLRFLRGWTPEAIKPVE